MTEASTKTTRRELLGLASSAGAALVALGGAGGLPLAALAQQRMPQRRIPATGEMLPVIGLGSSKPVEEIAKNGVEPITAVLRALVASGGKLVDTWPRNADNDAAFGRVASLPDLRDKLFVTTKIDKVGKDAEQTRIAANGIVSSARSDYDKELNSVKTTLAGDIQKIREEMKATM